MIMYLKAFCELTELSTSFEWKGAVHCRIKFSD